MLTTPPEAIVPKNRTGNYGENIAGFESTSIETGGEFACQLVNVVVRELLASDAVHNSCSVTKLWKVLKDVTVEVQRGVLYGR